MSDAVMVPREPTDEMLRAHLACDFPAMFREHLRYPMAGPDTAADQERMIAKARKRWSAMLAASPSVGGWEEPVAWRVRGPRGGWMHSDKLPSSWRNAEPLYAVPPPVSTGSRPQEAVPTEQADGGVVAAFADFVDAIKHAPISWETGCCCCGSPVEGHGFGDGHSPVDEGSYFVSSAIKAAEEAIARATPPATPIAGGLGSSPDGDTHRVAETAVVERRPFADVHAEAYGWTLDNDGFLAGLVAGDMGYDHTDLLLSDLLIDAQVAEGRRERTKQGGPYSWPFHDALMALVSTGYAAIQQAAPASDTTARYEPEASEPKDAARREEGAGQ